MENTEAPQLAAHQTQGLSMFDAQHLLFTGLVGAEGRAGTLRTGFGPKERALYPASGQVVPVPGIHKKSDAGPYSLRKFWTHFSRIEKERRGGGKSSGTPHCDQTKPFHIPAPTILQPSGDASASPAPVPQAHSR